MVKFLAALSIIGLQFYVYWLFSYDEVLPDRVSFVEFPQKVGEWQCTERETLTPDILEVLDVTDYLSCLFEPSASDVAPVSTQGDAPIETATPFIHLYVGYHARQLGGVRGEQGTAIHPPEHCLPGSGWDIIESDIVPVSFDGREGEAKRFVIAKGNLRNLVYFWYQMSGRVIARNHEKIFYTFVDRLFHQRSDGALVRFTVPIEKGRTDAAEAVFADFTSQVAPRLPAYLPD